MLKLNENHSSKVNMENMIRGLISSFNYFSDIIDDKTTGNNNLATAHLKRAEITERLANVISVDENLKLLK